MMVSYVLLVLMDQMRAKTLSIRSAQSEIGLELQFVWSVCTVSIENMRSWSSTLGTYIIHSKSPAERNFEARALKLEESRFNRSYL